MVSGSVLGSDRTLGSSPAFCLEENGRHHAVTARTLPAAGGQTQVALSFAASQVRTFPCRPLGSPFDTNIPFPALLSAFTAIEIPRTTARVSGTSGSSSGTGLMGATWTSTQVITGDLSTEMVFASIVEALQAPSAVEFDERVVGDRLAAALLSGDDPEVGEYTGRLIVTKESVDRDEVTAELRVSFVARPPSE